MDSADTSYVYICPFLSLVCPRTHLSSASSPFPSPLFMLALLKPQKKGMSPSICNLIGLSQDLRTFLAPGIAVQKVNGSKDKVTSVLRFSWLAILLTKFVGILNGLISCGLLEILFIIVLKYRSSKS